MSIICECGAKMACVDSRAAENITRRRYKCDCGRRLTTTEIIDVPEPPDYLRGVADGEIRMMKAIQAFAFALETQEKT